jgi:hypothetical protein
VNNGATSKLDSFTVEITRPYYHKAENTQHDINDHLKLNYEFEEDVLVQKDWRSFNLFLKHIKRKEIYEDFWSGFPKSHR